MLRIILIMSFFSIESIQNSGAYHFVDKSLRSMNYTQTDLLMKLKDQMRKDPLKERVLTKKDHRFIQSLTTLLGLRSEVDGYLDTRTYSVLSLLPPEVIKDCLKAMRRTWLLDTTFCTDNLPVSVYSIPLNLVEELHQEKKIKLSPQMRCPCFPNEKVEREAILRGKSSILTQEPFYLIRNHHGKLINRLPKRLTINHEAGFLEVVDIKKLKWQELLIMHNMALLANKSAGENVSSQISQLLYSYHLLPAKNKTTLNTLKYVDRTGNERLLLEMRLREIELS